MTGGRILTDNPIVDQLFLGDHAPLKDVIVLQSTPNKCSRLILEAFKRAAIKAGMPKVVA